MRWSFGPEFWALVALSALATILYGVVFLRRPPSLLRALVRAIPAAALSAALFHAGAFAAAVALAGAALGDFVLGFNKKWLLPLAAVFFVLAQLGYLGTLLPLWIFAGDLSPLWPRYAAIAIVILSVLGALIWLAPKLRWWALMVVPYAIPLTAVCMVAMWQDWRGWPAIPGAALWLYAHVAFAAANYRDTQIAASLRWWSYAAAHALLVTGAALTAPYMN